MFTINKNFKKTRITVLVLVITALLAGSTIIHPGAAYAAEEPEIIYYGNYEAQTILSNLNYTDIAGRNIWSKEAIYETGALGIVKSLDSGYRIFGRAVSLSKEEALTIAYRAAGREAEAIELGVAINNNRIGESKKTDPLAVMYDGFLQLAANEGLISPLDLADAFSEEQSQLPAGSFRRGNAAQRQEMAYWLARALNIEPVRQHREVLNYADWRRIDPDKISYMEAILGLGIMNGSGGRTNPTQAITREQAAQIVKNAESAVLQALSYIKNFGIVEEILTTRDYTGETAISGKNILIRNTNGRISSILTSVSAESIRGNRNENSGGNLTSLNGELIVYKNGNLGNSGLLAKGDRLQFITDSMGTVKYVDVVSNVNSTKYIAAQINSVDANNLRINVSELFKMDYPDVESIGNDVSFTGTVGVNTLYRVGADVVVTVNGIVGKLSDITTDATAILTIDRNNNIKEIQCIDFGINSEARRIVRGIVEENNPDLGYITLYNEDGSGTGKSNEAFLRTFNYIDQNATETFKNHKAVTPDSIQSGDTAYIKLDENGDIASISAVDNYIVKYGKVLSKFNSEIAVEFEDGTQQLLFAEDNIVVVKDKMLVGFKALREGDRVRLLINDTEKASDLKEITIEDKEHYISNIYKGTITKIDNMSGKITVMGLRYFDKGAWRLTDRKGFTTIPFAEGYSIYSGDRLLDAEISNKLYYSNEAYIAVEKGYGGEEKAVVISYKDSQDTDVPITRDSIYDTVSGSESFTLLRENRKINYLAGSIVVKYGRLVSGSSLAEKDDAYLALNRDYSNGEYYASVVKIDEPQNTNNITIYRGRIKGITDETDFTVESFSQLIGTSWHYSNTPKTFNITLSTRILADDGLLNIRDFKAYGEESYLNRTVYIVAEGINAVLVSTAPYGTGNIKGTVYNVSEDTFALRNAIAYNASTYMWESIPDASVSLLNNSIIIKDGRLINAANIKKGDVVRVVKKDATESGEGYIVFVE